MGQTHLMCIASGREPRIHNRMRKWMNHVESYECQNLNSPLSTCIQWPVTYPLMIISSKRKSQAIQTASQVTSMVSITCNCCSSSPSRHLGILVGPASVITAALLPRYAPFERMDGSRSRVKLLMLGVLPLDPELEAWPEVHRWPWEDFLALERPLRFKAQSNRNPEAGMQQLTMPAAGSTKVQTSAST